jgi:fumarylacetoacetase
MSWVPGANGSDFPIQNLPYGVFHLIAEDFSTARPGVRIGDFVVDLRALQAQGLFPHLEANVFSQPSLNQFMALGRPAWKQTRAVLTNLLATGGDSVLENNKAVLIDIKLIVNLLPARIGDYTDFYSSKEHASNVGRLFRPDAEPLLPNWTWLPVGYHGRASSVVVNGTPLRRPWGQVKAPTAQVPSFAKCSKLDFELEMAFFVGPSNKLGEPIPIAQSEDHIFGMVIMNDWSARDIQAWEYVPLGPFTGKNLGTTVSPWIVTLEALEPFRCKSPVQDPPPMGYLNDGGNTSYDINLEVHMATAGGEAEKILTSNFKYMYWSMCQQLTHHSITGCNMNSGDLLGSGTISGPGELEYGSLLEYSLNGKRPFKINGQERSFINDGDSINLKGFCQGDGYRIGFGDCEGTILPALEKI